ncbi:MAG: heavy metal translocating P-type ATPase [Salinigranum sp.]
MTDCSLCDLSIRGDPVTADAVDGSFCCRGCLEVYRTLGDVTPAELEERTADATATEEVPEDAATAFLDVEGMHCKTCEAFIEGTAAGNDGVYAAEASYTTEMVKLTYDPAELEEDALPSLVSRLGYRATLPGTTTAGEEDEWFTVERIRTVLGVLGAMAVMVLYIFFLYPTYLGIYPRSFLYERATSIMVFTPIPLLTSFVLFFGGFPILRGAYVSLKTGQPNMDVLVAFGATAAYVYSMVTLLAGGRVVYFDVTAVIVAVVTAGNYLESMMKREAVGSLADIGARRVTEARVRRPVGSEVLPVEEVRPGDELIVKAGERVPMDGRVIEGWASVDEALISGESTPLPKEPGEEVLSGSLVLDRRVVIEVGEDATSTLDRIVSQMWNIKSSGGGAQRVADRLAAVFVPGVLVLAAGVAVADLAFGEPVAAAILTGVSVLVVSCPCSLGLATPMAIASGVARAAEKGVVVMNASALEAVADVDVVALDKTGTLTTGEMRVGDVTAVGVDAETLLDRAAAVESAAVHPVADAVVEAAGASDAVLADVESHPRGAFGRVDGVETLVGHPALFAEYGWEVPDPVTEAVERLRDSGAIATVVGWDGRARGVVEVYDEPREGWADTVSELAAGGERTVVVLTGDDQSSVRAFESHPDVEHVFTGMLPEAKAATIRRLAAEHGAVAMVGDGINDAPALAAADLGVALADGSELASDAADVTVVDRGIDAVVDLFERGKTTHSRVRQNLGWALAYNAVAIPLAVAGLINPLIAAVAMAASSILVVANSAR